MDRYFVEGTLSVEQLEAVRLVSKGHPTLQRTGFKNGLQYIDTSREVSRYQPRWHGILLEAPEGTVPRGVLAEELQHAIDFSAGLHSGQRISAWKRVHGVNFNTRWHQSVFRRIADTIESDETSILRFL